MYTSGLPVGRPRAGADIDSGAWPRTTAAHGVLILKTALLDHPDVTNLRSVETAVVPIMTFDFCEVNIDFICAPAAQCDARIWMLMKMLFYRVLMRPRKNR